MLPKLLEIGPIPIHTYGLLLAIALLASISLAARLGESDGIPRRYTWDLGFIIVVSAILGAKVLMVLTSFSFYWEDPSRLFSIEFIRAGGVYYGGFLGAVAGAAIYAWRQPPISFWKFADVAAPAIPLGQAIGRLGCFAAGCDYGTPCNLPWSVTFTSEYARRMVGTPLNIPLHPYQLYESFASLGLLALLLWVFSRRSFQGQVFSLYLVGYGLIRFFLENFRGDEDRGFVMGGLLSTSQFISLLLIPAGIALFLVMRRRAHAR